MAGRSAIRKARAASLLASAAGDMVNATDVAGMADDAEVGSAGLEKITTRLLRSGEIAVPVLVGGTDVSDAELSGGGGVAGVLAEEVNASSKLSRSASAQMPMPAPPLTTATPVPIATFVPKLNPPPPPKLIELPL